MKNVFYLCVFTLGLIGCDKNKQAVNNLEGEWSIDTYIFDSINYKIESAKMEFEVCDLTKEDCEGEYYLLASYTEVNGSFEVLKQVDFIQKFDYAVTESGNEMFMTFVDENGFVSSVEFDMELKENKLDLTSVDGSFEIELERKD